MFFYALKIPGKGTVRTASAGVQNSGRAFRPGEFVSHVPLPTGRCAYMWGNDCSDASPSDLSKTIHCVLSFLCLGGPYRNHFVFIYNIIFYIYYMELMLDSYISEFGKRAVMMVHRAPCITLCVYLYSQRDRGASKSYAFRRHTRALHERSNINI